MIINPYVYAATGPQPSDLSGLELWLKADGIVGLNNDDPITTWPDSSGNGRDATAVQDVTRKPIWKATAGPNSKPCVEMISASGDGGHFTLPDFLTGFTAGDIFFVVQLDSNSPAVGFAAPVDGDWGTAGDDYFNFGGQIYDGFGLNSRVDAITQGANVLTSWLEFEIRNSASEWKYLILDTVEAALGAHTVAWSTTPKIAFTTTNTKKMKGRVAEVIFYSRILDNVTERKPTVNVYLNSKYGFGLPT